MKASVTLLIPISSSNEDQNSERSGGVSPLSNGRLCPCACEKIPGTFAHRVPLFILIILTSPVYPCVGVCIGVCPSHTTHAQPISAARAAVEAP